MIARTLTTLTTGALPKEIEVIVVCNGCTDDTASIARTFGPPVRVIETPTANKTHALNLGDEAASAFPRVYSDADILLTLPTIQALVDRLHNGVLAVAPKPHFDVTGSSWPVRAFYNIRHRLPSFGEGIGGSGVYALSEIGRCRFHAFPDLVADDTYVRIQFTPEERETLSSAESIVFAPHRLKDLIAIETRADFGSFQLAGLYPHLWTNKGASNHKRLMVLFLNPFCWARLAVYLYVRTIARHNARTRSRNKTFTWERDDTSRSTAQTSAPLS